MRENQHDLIYNNKTVSSNVYLDTMTSAQPHQKQLKSNLPFPDD